MKGDKDSDLLCFKTKTGNLAMQQLCFSIRNRFEETEYEQNMTIKASFGVYTSQEISGAPFDFIQMKWVKKISYTTSYLF